MEKADKRNKTEESGNKQDLYRMGEEGDNIGGFPITVNVIMTWPDGETNWTTKDYEVEGEDYGSSIL